ncbi:MAG TPA: hypothetical protein VN903_39255 [Polyangia bacterium]|nr:hypothetical protein [Polyangia bacterium]
MKRRARFTVAALAVAIGAIAFAMVAVAEDAVAPAAGAAPAPAPPKPQSANVRIVFTVLPSTKKATVFWGKKKLGAIAPHAPLIVQRPRDSGPLDVVVRAEGCVPVQTRAYTFEDSKVAVKVTPNDQKNTLLGYREEVPADGGAPAGNPDGGAFFSR